MKLTEVDENTFRASIETRFNNVKKCATLPKLIEFINVIEATERTIVEKGIDPNEFGLKLSTAAVSAIPETIEGGILRHKAILKKLKWRKIREKAFRERLAKESEERRKDAAKWFGREMDYSTT